MITLRELVFSQAMERVIERNKKLASFIDEVTLGKNIMSKALSFEDASVRGLSKYGRYEVLEFTKYENIVYGANYVYTYEVKGKETLLGYYDSSLCYDVIIEITQDTLDKKIHLGEAKRLLTIRDVQKMMEVYREPVETDIADVKLTKLIDLLEYCYDVDHVVEMWIKGNADEKWCHERIALLVDKGYAGIYEGEQAIERMK